MGGCELTLILRYRKAVTYGHHVLLAALEEHETATRYEVVFADTESATVEAVQAARGSGRVLVLWSFYSPDAAALAEELQRIKAAAPGAVHVAGGVHATAEPVQTLDAGWDIAAVGEGESTFLALVDNGGEPAGITGLVYRDDTGALVRSGKAHREPLGRYRAFPVTYRRMNPIEITRGCIYACRFCQTPFMFSAKFRHRSVENVRWHVDRMREAGKRDVRFITPTSLSYGTDGEEPDLAAVEELLASCKEGIGPDGRVFFGSFPSEIRPEHMTVDALRLVKRYCANDNLIVGAQSGSERILDAAKRGHDVESVRRAVHLGIAEGFRINVDMIFGMPGEEPQDAAASLALAQELADLGARIHSHVFMPLPGTPWRDAPPGDVDPETIRVVSRLAQQGALYGHWEKQREHATRLAAAAVEYPRPRPQPHHPAAAGQLSMDLNELLPAFFRAVSFEPDGRPDYEAIRSLFVPGGLLVKAPEVMGIDGFIAPRLALVTSGALTEFEESELDGETRRFGNVAQRWSHYAKRGVQHGAAFAATGWISTQFVNTPAGWLMTAMTWDDEQP